MFWGAFDALLYALAPLCALVALIYADLEWFFPAYAIRVMFPSFMLIGPVLFTIVSFLFRGRNKINGGTHKELLCRRVFAGELAKKGVLDR